MSKLILYLLEASALLTIFYSLYLLLLRKETFFSLNRFFLLTILVFSFLFPIMSFDFSVSKSTMINEPIEDLSGMRMSYYDALAAWSQEGMVGQLNSESAQKKSSNAGSIAVMVLLAIYAIGLMAMMSRLIWTYIGIYRLKLNYPQVRIDGVRVVKLPYQIAPFSFMNAVFVHGDMLDSEEFDQILAHEKTHIRQKHSLDLMFVQLLAAILWFNPVVWLLIKSLKTTHEYIADKKMINQGYSLVEYQSLLLRQLISNNSFGLVHNFNLLFIKKRITMMKIEESGWAGKVKVALVLSVVAVFSLVMIQCNSKVLDDQLGSTLSVESQANEAGMITYTLPELPEIGFKYNIDPNNSLEVVIHGGQVQLNGEIHSLDEIGMVIEEAGLTKSGIIVMKVDRHEPMSFVRDVQWELRKANRRKLLYVGRTAEGKKVEMALLLPPHPDSNDGIQLPTIDEEYAKTHDIEILKIDLANHLGTKNQQQVYDFVMDQVSRERSNYVVSAKHDDEDSYGDYLLNVTYIQKGFYQIYQERTQSMFGKSFYDLDKTDEKEKEQYKAVRKGIPMAISVAER